MATDSAALESLALDVGRTAVTEKAVERLGEGPDMAGLEQRLGDVGPTDRGLAGDLPHPLPCDRRAELGEPRHHLHRAADPPVAQPGQPALKVGVLVAQEEAEHVDVAAGGVGAQLDAGDDLDAEATTGLDGDCHAAGRVMVGERHAAYAVARGEHDQLGRSQPAVGLEAMEVEVDRTA